MEDPLDEIFVEEQELNLPTAKVRLSKKEKEVDELKGIIGKLQDDLKKRENLLESTESDRQELLKENNEMRKNLRNLERIDQLETQMSELKQDMSETKENTKAYLNAINYWKDKHNALAKGGEQ